MRHVVLILSVLSAGGLWSLAAPPETPPPEAEPSETESSETEQPETAPPEAPPNANLPSFELTRGERPITVQQTALDEEGGIAVTRGGSSCRDDENISFFYAPDPKRIDTTVDNTRIRSSIVFRSQPKEGGAAAQDRAVLDFYGGSLGVNEETGCPRNLERDAAQRVVITEGRTTVEGGPLRYENSSGVGEMDGPVDLERRATDDSPALTGSAAYFLFNVDSDLQTLRGGVEVESDGRTSEADSLVLDEEAGFAVLRGSPARSRDEEGEVVGSIIEYDLDTNDVVVTEGVEGTFTLDLGDDEPAQPNPGFSGEDGSNSESDPNADLTDESSSDGGAPETSDDDTGGDPPAVSDDE